MISHPFRIGFVQVNKVICRVYIAFAKLLEHPSYTSMFYKAVSTPSTGLSGIQFSK